jgi:hypothetical protein
MPLPSDPVSAIPRLRLVEPGEARELALRLRLLVNAWADTDVGPARDVAAEAVRGELGAHLALILVTLDAFAADEIGLPPRELAQAAVWGQEPAPVPQPPVPPPGDWRENPVRYTPPGEWDGDDAPPSLWPPPEPRRGPVSDATGERPGGDGPTAATNKRSGRAGSVGL